MAEDSEAVVAASVVSGEAASVEVEPVAPGKEDKRSKKEESQIGAIVSFFMQFPFRRYMISTFQ